MNTRTDIWVDCSIDIGKSITIKDALHKAKIDYTVIKTNVYTKVNRKEYKIDGIAATLRTDTNKVLGTVGADYPVMQNRDAFAFLNDLIHEHVLQLEYAGSIDYGTTAYVVLSTNQESVIQAEHIRTMVHVSNSHDGVGSIQVIFCAERSTGNVIIPLPNCPSLKSVSFKHTKKPDEAMYKDKLLSIVAFNSPYVTLALSKAYRVSMNVTDGYNYLFAAIAGTTEEVASTRYRNMVHTIMNYHHTDELFNGCRNTLYGYFISVCAYYQNIVKEDGGADRLKSMLYGTGGKKISVAFNLLLTKIKTTKT